MGLGYLEKVLEFYDRDIKTWDKEKSPSFLKNIFENKRELKYWGRVNNLLLGKPDTWDYQWQYLCFVNSGLSCMPYVNLVENIGFGEGATHTTDLPVGSIDNIREKGRMQFPLIIQ